MKNIKICVISGELPPHKNYVTAADEVNENLIKLFDKLNYEVFYVFIDENITINKAVEILWSFRDIDLDSIQKLTAPVSPYELKDGRQVLVLKQNLYEFLSEEDIINQ